MKRIILLIIISFLFNSAVLANNQIESEVLNLEPEKDISNLGIDELERAMLLYSYIGHAYIWGNLKTDKVIPKNIDM